MENASKALIIAGAILVSILIIGLGMTLYNNAAGTLERANIDETAVRQYNAGFTEYEGQTNVKGANIKALYRDVMTHNRSVGDDTSLLIVIENVNDDLEASDNFQITTETTAAVNANAQNCLAQIQNGKTYAVSCQYDDTTGYVTKIGVRKVN